MWSRDDLDVGNNVQSHVEAAEKSRENQGCVDKKPARRKDREFNPI